MEQAVQQRYKELRKIPKPELAQMHVASGGLMGLATYLKWTKEELISVVLEDEGHGLRGTQS